MFSVVVDRIEFVCGAIFFFQAEDGIRDLVRSRGLGDVYKRQAWKDRDRLLLIVHLQVADVPQVGRVRSCYQWQLLSLIHI